MPAPTIATTHAVVAAAPSHGREILHAAAREILAPARREILIAERLARVLAGQPTLERPRPEPEVELPFDTVEQGFEWILTGRLRVWRE